MDNENNEMINSQPIVSEPQQQNVDADTGREKKRRLVAVRQSQPGGVGEVINAQPLFSTLSTTAQGGGDVAIDDANLSTLTAEQLKEYNEEYDALQQNKTRVRTRDYQDDMDLLVDLQHRKVYKNADEENRFDANNNAQDSDSENDEWFTSSRASSDMRVKLGTGLGDSDDEEGGSMSDIDADSSDDDSNGGGDYDDEFMDLIKDFAQMDLPKYYSAAENCPMCSKQFKIEDFAEHVYSCIRSLDPEEKRQLEDMDAQLAYMLAFEEEEDFNLLGALQNKTGFDLEEARQDAEQSGAMGDGETKNILNNPPPKKDALKDRFESFVANQALVWNQYKFHQKGKKMGECCICGLAMPYGDLDSHVLGCLNTSPRYRLGKGKKKDSSAQQQQPKNAMSDAATDQTTTPVPQPTTTTTTSKIDPAPAANIPAFRSTQDDDVDLDNTADSLPPFLNNNDDDSDDDGPVSSAIPQQQQQNDNLNSRQIGLMARMVHQRANNAFQPQGDDAASLNDLLVQFRALGLNKDALKRAKEDLLQNPGTEQEQQQNQDQQQ